MLASRSACLDFDDPDAFAAALPGGKFGVLPLEKGPFRARAYLSNLMHGVVVRGVATSGPVAFRSEFIGSAQVITYLFAVTNRSGASFDGADLGGASLVSRKAGATPNLRTHGPHELGAVVMLEERLRRATAAFTGRDHARLLLAPASLHRVDPLKIEQLKQKYFEVTAVLDQRCRENAADAGAAGVEILRDELLAAIVDAMTGGLVKRDHLARQLRTASMARIERFINEHRDDPAGLQKLCEETGLALRTVEAIVHERVGMPAHTYLARRRLAFARDALLNPNRGATVTNVAMHFGFMHLGRFSSFYRQAYGELPSATLRRVLGQNADENDKR